MSKKSIKLENGTLWPNPKAGSNLSWKLRHNDVPLTKSERLHAASVLEAYKYLTIGDCVSLRDSRDTVRMIRLALKVVKK